MGKRILVFLKHTWLLIPAIFTGVSEIFKWWGINKMPPHWLFWLLLIIGIVIAILLTNNELKKKGEESKDKNKFTKQEALEIASRFTTLMTQILSAQTQDDMAKIQTQVRNEWIKCPDKGLAKEMDICIKAVNWMTDYNVQKDNEITRDTLDQIVRRLTGYIHDRFSLWNWLLT